MRDCEAIGKDQKNQQQGFMFRGIDQVYGSLHAIMAKHAVVSVPIKVESHTEERTNKNGTLLRHTTSTVTYRFLADDGSFVDGQVIGEGMDSGDKAASKSLAIAHKYFLLQTFLIPTEEAKDPDAESHEVQPRKKPAPKADEPKFNGAAHKELYEFLADHFINDQDFIDAMKHYKHLPDAAKSFWKMSEETAKKFLSEKENIEMTVTEWNALHKP